MSSPIAEESRSGAGAAGWDAAGWDAAGWDAAIDLEFVAAGGSTVLVRHGQRGPLMVQRPLFPEGPEVCHLYLLHPPGGLVGGDRLRARLRVAGGAHALCTTPAASKLYRSGGAPARVEQRLSVAGDGVLEWLPQETILYDGAIADLRTRIDLGDDARARFIGIEMLCFGLPARGEGFGRGRCRQRLELWRAGRPIVIERGRLDGDRPVHAARWGLGGATVMGTLLAAPAFEPARATAGAAAAVMEALRELAGALPAGDLGSASVLGEGAALVCRYLGASAERGRRFLHAAWRLIRPALLGRPAIPPRIWAT